MRVHQFTIQTDIPRSDLVSLSSASSHFMSDITMEYSSGENEHLVDMKSLLGMMTMTIKAGTPIRILTKGKDDEEALHYVFDLFQPYL
jgi:phosphocarrier protein